MSSSPELLANGLNFTPTIRNDTYPYIDPSAQDLTGKAICITGASKGIGRATALSFARAGATYIALGARSSLSSLSTEIQAAAKSANRPEPQVLCLTLDVTSESSTEAAARTVQESFGRLDILFNNAGYLSSFTPTADSDPAEWWRTWEVNIKGPYLVSRAFLPLLLGSAEGAKTIVSASSVGAHMIMPGASAYQGSKLALLRQAEFVQVEYGAKGLLTYCLHPGGVETELSGVMPEHIRSKVLIDQPALAADTVVWLTSQRREWLAGRYISATWDMEQFLAKREEIEKGDLLKLRMAVKV